MICQIIKTKRRKSNARLPVMPRPPERAIYDTALLRTRSQAAQLLGERCRRTDPKGALYCSVSCHIYISWFLEGWRHRGHLNRISSIYLLEVKFTPALCSVRATSRPRRRGLWYLPSATGGAIAAWRSVPLAVALARGYSSLWAVPCSVHKRGTLWAWQRPPRHGGRWGAARTQGTRATVHVRISARVVRSGSAKGLHGAAGLE